MHSKFATRKQPFIGDIEGTQAKSLHPLRNKAGSIGNANQLDYRDVTQVGFKSTRVTDPLMPKYLVRDEDKGYFEVGPIKGNAPSVLPPARKDPNFLKTSLQTADITGCKTSTKGLGNFHSRERRAYLNSVNTLDVHGAQPGSLKRGITSDRQLHPLMPNY